MGLNLYVSNDENLEDKYTFWMYTSGTFKAIFNRTFSHFRHYEIEAKKECVREEIWDGIDLCNVSKESFNILYLRCSEALKNYAEEFVKDRFVENYFKGEEEGKAQMEYMLSEFKETLKMLEKDKRYDPQWIREYELTNNIRSYED